MKINLHLAQHVVIIGGGFCGMMLAANLVQKTAGRLKISIIEKSAQIGKGIAYGTTDPNHLLNVFADKMGAFEGQPDHFYRWLVENEPEWRKLHPSFTELELRNDVCLPRMLYGAYLESIWKETLALAESKGIEIMHLKQEAVNLFKYPNNQICVASTNGNAVEADIVALAIGVPDNKDIPLESWLGIDNGYISNIWSQAPGNILHLPSLSHLNEDAQIVIIGSGLTMLDAFATLMAKGFKGKIVSITAVGKFPEPHRTNVEPKPPIIDLKNPPKTALALFKTTRKALKKGADKGVDWRCIIDSFRPITIQLWQSYPWKERGKFFRFLINHWNLHRHRMPASSTEKIEKEKAEGKLMVVPGFIEYIDYGTKKPLLVKYHNKAEGASMSIEADYVLNCTGPKSNVTKIKSTLLRNLLEKNFAQADPLKLGIQVTEHYEVKGEVKGKLFAMGLLLLGERFETIAVPELRTQCAEVADQILSSL